MKVFSKRIITLFICAILLVTTCFISTFAGVDLNGDNAKTIFTKGNKVVFEGESQIVAQSDMYNLVCNKEPVAFSLINKETSEIVFSTSVSNDTYDVENSSNLWKNYMQAIVAIKYAGKDEYKGTTIQDFSSAKTTKVSIFETEKGVWVDLEFTKPMINFSVIVELDNNVINVTIPENSIKENGEYELLNVEVFPFMGATPNDREGYILYPDGAGALTYFDKINEKHLYTKPHSLDIYSSISQLSLESDTNSAMLPVYGIKTGNTAFLAAITSGDSSASIKINPGINTSPVKLNRASFEFTYRNSHRFYLSNIVVDGKDVSTNIYGTEWDEELIPGDRCVKFFVLENDEANYSGMANSYRSYLINSGKLLKNPSVKDYRTAVTMVMGAMEETIFASNYVSVTSFDDVSDFVNQYDKLGMSNYLITLSGWNKGGIYNYNSFYKPEPSIGGSSGLKKLNSLKHDIFLETDILSNAKERNSIKQGNLIPVTNADKTRFIANLNIIAKKYQKMQKTLNKYSNLNGAYLNIGSSVFYNADGKISFREDAINKYRELISKSNKSTIKGGNLYLLDLVDYLYDIPVDTSDNVIIDEEVPFYSMVVYGSLPYSSVSGNNSNDFNKTKLKWLEYGCIPYFEITKDSPQKLQNSDRNFLYSSKNEYWKDVIAECNNEWTNNLSVINDCYMIKHEVIDQGIVKIDYSNGYYIVINYRDEDIVYQNETIGSENYILRKG